MQEMQETQVGSLGLEDPLESEMATQSSSLAWKIPWMEGDGGATGLQRVKTGLRDFTFFLSFTPYYQV